MTKTLDSSIIPRTLSLTLMFCLFRFSTFFLISNCSPWLLLEELNLYASHKFFSSSPRETRSLYRIWSLDLYLSYLEQVSQKNPSFGALEETFFATPEETSFVPQKKLFFVDPRRNLLLYSLKSRPSYSQKKLPLLAQKKLSLSLLRTSLCSPSSLHFFTECMSS